MWNNEPDDLEQQRRFILNGKEYREGKTVNDNKRRNRKIKTTMQDNTSFKWTGLFIMLRIFLIIGVIMFFSLLIANGVQAHKIFTNNTELAWEKEKKDIAKPKPNDLEIVLLDNSYFTFEKLIPVVQEIFRNTTFTVFVEGQNIDGDYVYYNYCKSLLPELLERDEYGLYIRNLDVLFKEQEGYFRLKELSYYQSIDTYEYIIGRNDVHGVDNEILYQAKLFTDSVASNEIVGVIFSIVR